MDAMANHATVTISREQERQPPSSTTPIQEWPKPLQSEQIASSDSLPDLLSKAAWTAEELLGCYAAVVYRSTGSYEATAKRLELDRRTVKAKVESYLKQSVFANAKT